MGDRSWPNLLAALLRNLNAVDALRSWVRKRVPDGSFSAELLIGVDAGTSLMTNGLISSWLRTSITATPVETKRLTKPMKLPPTGVIWKVSSSLA